MGDSGCWLRVRQRLGHVSGPAGVQYFVELCPDQLAVLGRYLGSEARGVVDRQLAEAEHKIV